MERVEEEMTDKEFIFFLALGIGFLAGYFFVKYEYRDVDERLKQLQDDYDELNKSYEELQKDTRTLLVEYGKKNLFLDLSGYTKYKRLFTVIKLTYQELS